MTKIEVQSDFFPVAFYGLTDLNGAWTKKPIARQIESLEDLDSVLSSQRE